MMNDPQPNFDPHLPTGLHSHPHDLEHNWGPAAALAPAVTAQAVKVCEVLTRAAQDPNFPALLQTLLNDPIGVLAANGVQISLPDLKTLLHIGGSSDLEFRSCLALRIQHIKEGKAHDSGLNCGCG